MNERKAALIARIQQLHNARLAEIRAIARLEARPRIRILDRAFAQIGAACLMLAIFAGSAEARTISKPIGYWVRSGGQTTVVVYAPPLRQMIVYQTNVIRPTCPPVAAPTPRPRFQGSSKYAAGN
ncbi:hypothetical protein [Lacipirellula sp.]|uniref:hypothetical protein n=1 Tax=Lacipirellula sp. TaxID=2691419 RepID=UPI003D0EC98B